MALKSGLNAQIGYAAESTWGTAVTPTRFIPLVSEKLEQKIARLESKAILPGRRVLDSSQWAAGNVEIAGSVQHELYDHNLAIIFEHMFGSRVRTGAGPFTDTCTPGDLTGKGLTVQVGKPDVNNGTVQPFTYAGCKVAKWQLAGKAGEIVTLGLDLVGKSETTATALATASYATLVPVTFLNGAVTLGGSAVNVKQFTLSGDNKLDAARRYIGTATIAEPLEADQREYAGSLMLEFEGLTQYNRFVNATSAALVLTFTVGSNTLTITTNVRVDGETPNVAGTKIIEQPLKVKCHGTTDAAAITAVLVTSDATP